MGERHLLAAVCIIAAAFVGVLTLISDGGSTPSAAVDQPSTPSETNSTQAEDETLLGEDNPLTAKIAPWQVGASYDVVLARFDKAASGGTRCDSLVALTSLPDLKLLATLSRPSWRSTSSGGRPPPTRSSLSSAANSSRSSAAPVGRSRPCRNGSTPPAGRSGPVRSCSFSPTTRTFSTTCFGSTARWLRSVPLPRHSGLPVPRRRSPPQRSALSANS